MAKVIDMLYEGQLEPVRSIGKNNVEMRRMEYLIDRNKSKLKEALDNNERETLEKYSECINEYIVLITEQAFNDGFCLGARILSEAVSGAENLL